MKKLFILLMLLPLVCKADETALHLAAHVGTSYALNTVAYGICQKGEVIKSLLEDKDDKVPCIMLSAFTTTLVGFLYKHLEKSPAPTPDDFARSMFFNSIGTSLSVGSILVFDF